MSVTMWLVIAIVVAVVLLTMYLIYAMSRDEPEPPVVIVHDDSLNEHKTPDPYTQLKTIQPESMVVDSAGEIVGGITVPEAVDLWPAISVLSKQYAELEKPFELDFSDPRAVAKTVRSVMFVGMHDREKIKWPEVWKGVGKYSTMPVSFNRFSLAGVALCDLVSEFAADADADALAKVQDFCSAYAKDYVEYSLFNERFSYECSACMLQILEVCPETPEATKARQKVIDFLEKSVPTVLKTSSSSFAILQGSVVDGHRDATQSFLETVGYGVSKERDLVPKFHARLCDMFYANTNDFGLWHPGKRYTNSAATHLAAIVDMSRESNSDDDGLAENFTQTGSSTSRSLLNIYSGDGEGSQQQLPVLLTHVRLSRLNDFLTADERLLVNNAASNVCSYKSLMSRSRFKALYALSTRHGPETIIKPGGTFKFHLGDAKGGFSMLGASTTFGFSPAPEVNRNVMTGLVVGSEADIYASDAKVSNQDVMQPPLCNVYLARELEPDYENPSTSSFCTVTTDDGSRVMVFSRRLGQFGQRGAIETHFVKSERTLAVLNLLDKSAVNESAPRECVLLAFNGLSRPDITELDSACAKRLLVDDGTKRLLLCASTEQKFKVNVVQVTSAASANVCYRTQISLPVPENVEIVIDNEKQVVQYYGWTLTVLDDCEPVPQVENFVSIAKESYASPGQINFAVDGSRLSMHTFIHNRWFNAFRFSPTTVPAVYKRDLVFVRPGVKFEALVMEMDDESLTRSDSNIDKVNGSTLGTDRYGNRTLERILIPGYAYNKVKK